MQCWRKSLITDALLIARASLGEQLARLQKRLVSLARDDQRARLLMSTPGVGVLVALTYVAAVTIRAGSSRLKPPVRIHR
jgi:transposase